MTLLSVARAGLRGLDAAGGFLSRPRKTRWLYLTAFLLPVLVMGLLWALKGAYPFGDGMILASDQWHQYYPFFLDLRRRILEGHSLLHSWTTGMGINYLPLAAYYLASPLNLLSVLVPEDLLLPWYTLMVLVRLGLAGLFCAVFLKNVFGRRELAAAAFSTAYALCAFLMGYYWNAIWLDTVALLPLVVLGTVRLLGERRCGLYVLSLALAVFCNYYIALFVCAYVLLLFIGWSFVKWDGLAGFWSRFRRISLYTALALGMTAVLTLPAFLALRATSAAGASFPSDALLNALRRGDPAELLTAVREMLWSARNVLGRTGSLTIPTVKLGQPNVACGFLTLILAVSCFFLKPIPPRERIFSAALLLFFGLSFVSPTLNFLWHGLHVPNMLPHRFSFLWSFTVIWMAFRAYTLVEELPPRRLPAVAIPVAFLLVCVIQTNGTRVTVSSLLAAVFALGALLLFGFRRIGRGLLTLGVCGCMLVESVGCAALGVRAVGLTDYSKYPSKKEDTEAVLETMLRREEDTVDLWRAEMADYQTANDGTFLGYRGVSVFSSSVDSRVSTFLYGIGLSTTVAGNQYAYREADPYTNLLLGLKYMIDRHGQNLDPLYWEDVERQGEVRLMENRAYLSLGYMVGDETLEYEARHNTILPFVRLNELFGDMTGLEGELFDTLELAKPAAVGTASFIPVDTPDTRAERAVSFRIGGVCGEDDYVQVSLEMPRDGMLCVYSRSAAAGDVTWLLNGELQYSWPDVYGYNRCMGFFSAGDRIDLRYMVRDGMEGIITVGAAVFDTGLFDRGYAILAERSMTPVEIGDTHVEGRILAAEPGLLYLSIPADDGWTLFVDGEETSITPVGDAMIAVHLEPGEHEIALDYDPPGFREGLAVSLASLALTLIVLTASRHAGGRAGKNRARKE